MTNMKNNIIESFDTLMRVIEEYHIRDVHAQLGELADLKGALSNDLEFLVREQLSIHRALFTPRVGLLDIHYWDNSFEK